MIRLSVSMKAPSSFAKNDLGLRRISTSRPCQSIDEFFISQPNVDKEGKVVYPAVGVNSNECVSRIFIVLTLLGRARLDSSRAQIEIF